MRLFSFFKEILQTLTIGENALLARRCVSYIIREIEEPSDVEISSLSDRTTSILMTRTLSPEIVLPLSSSARSRSDRTPSKFKQDTKKGTKARYSKKGTQMKHKNQRGTGASSSGPTPEERARSLLLPTIDEAEDSVPRERSQG